MRGLVVSGVLPRPRALTQQEAEVVYATIDRLLRGGRSWPELSQAPAATREFYRALQSVRFSGESSILGTLDDIIKPQGVEMAGDHFRDICASFESAGKVVTTAVALKNGHAVEGAEAVPRLFEVDLQQLPPFRRTGHSGYEL